MNNLTTITPPRVALIDPRTGLISREWYRFFLNLFTLTGSGETDITVLTVHDTETLNLATQTFAHQPPQAMPFDYDQNILATQTFLNNQKEAQLAFDQIILGVQTFLNKHEPVMDYASDQQILANRIFGG